MNSNYLRALDKLVIASSEIETLVKNAPMMQFEDIRACTLLENAIDEMNTATSRIKMYTKPVVEGVLSEMSNGKFELIDKTGDSVAYFSCGRYLEVYSDEDKTWYSGRVEHNGKYYLRCSDMDNTRLYDGMRARIRKDE